MAVELRLRDTSHVTGVLQKFKYYLKQPFFGLGHEMCRHPAHRGCEEAEGARQEVQKDDPPRFCPRRRGGHCASRCSCLCKCQKCRQVGGLEGMKLFVHTPEFKAMNVGFGLDEGIAGPKEVMPLFYGERNVFWIKVNSNWQKAYLESIEGDLPWKSWTWIHVPGEHCRGKGSIYDQQTFGLQAT